MDLFAVLNILGGIKMMNEETLRKLTEMKMGAMAEFYQQQG